MSAHSLYFRIFDRLFAALATASDPMVSGTVERLRNMFHLMDLRAATGQTPTLDRRNSGLPILSDVISLSQAIARAELPKRPPKDLRDILLDEMLIRRRLPRDHQIRDMGRAVYQTALFQAPNVFFPEPSDIDPFTDGAYLRLSWELWDGSSSAPVVCRAWFEERERRMIDENLIRSLGRRFSGTSYSPLAMAIEFDDAIEHLRLKRLRKVTFGPFLSPIFSASEHVFANLLADVSNDEDSWMFFWRVDEVISTGTVMEGGGFFRSARPRERFVTDTSDAELVNRGASSTRQHLVCPPIVFQKVADTPPGTPVADALLRTRKHVVATDGALTENI